MSTATPTKKKKKKKKTTSLETKRIGLRVKAFRDVKEWSFTDLVKASGMDRSRLWTLEHGEHRPSVDTLDKLAKVFGATYLDLVGLVDPLLILHRRGKKRKTIAEMVRD